MFSLTKCTDPSAIRKWVPPGCSLPMLMSLKLFEPLYGVRLIPQVTFLMLPQGVPLQPRVQIRYQLTLGSSHDISPTRNVLLVPSVKLAAFNLLLGKNAPSPPRSAAGSHTNQVPKLKPYVCG